MWIKIYFFTVKIRFIAQGGGGGSPPGLYIGGGPAPPPAPGSYSHDRLSFIFLLLLPESLGTRLAKGQLSSFGNYLTMSWKFSTNITLLRLPYCICQADSAGKV